MSIRILVAEDDPKQAQVVQIYLRREGYAVRHVVDGRAAIEQARAYRPHLVVLDVMMPYVDGLEVCRALRAESTVAILLLTARSTENDLLLGLDNGADDYMVKPYSPRELAARVRALLRRSTGGAATEPPVLKVGSMELDAARFEVRLADRQVTLTAREFAILEVLAREPGRVFTRTEIIDRAFGDAVDVLSRTVDVHVVSLRRKLADGSTQSRAVETVHGRGYRLAAGQ